MNKPVCSLCDFEAEHFYVTVDLSGGKLDQYVARCWSHRFHTDIVATSNGKVMIDQHGRIMSYALVEKDEYVVGRIMES